jgi:hypothetical protein
MINSQEPNEKLVSSFHISVGVKKLITTSVLLLNIYVVSAQQMLVKGNVRDSVSGERLSIEATRIILNDTISKSNNDRFALPKNKRKIVRRSLKERIRDQKKDSIAIQRTSELWNDKRYVAHPDAEGNFEIMASPNDSLFTQSSNYINKNFLVSDLLKNAGKIELVHKICEPVFHCDETNPKLYAFIGEKIDAKYSDQYYCQENGVTTIPMDARYLVKYKILKNISGGYPNDTISFESYSHYGKPEFIKYKYVLLFVSEHCGRLFHEKYQYFDVYPTIDGRWARPGDPYRFDGHLPRIKTASRIRFKNNLSFDISNEYTYVIKQEYPKGYFKMTRERAYPMKGVYLEDLLYIKGTGVLKARGFKFQ